MFYSPPTSRTYLVAGSGLTMPSQSPSLQNSEESDGGLSPYFPIVDTGTQLTVCARELVRYLHPLLCCLVFLNEQQLGAVHWIFCKMNRPSLR